MKKEEVKFTLFFYTWLKTRIKGIIKGIIQIAKAKDGPLENFWGRGGGRGGEVQKKYSRKGKINEKKLMHAN